MAVHICRMDCGAPTSAKRSRNSAQRRSAFSETLSSRACAAAALLCARAVTQTDTSERLAAAAAAAARPAKGNIRKAGKTGKKIDRMAAPGYA